MFDDPPTWMVSLGFNLVLLTAWGTVRVLASVERWRIANHHRRITRIRSRGESRPV